MSNLNTFVDKVKSVIESNTELKNSVVLNKVLESVRYTGDDTQFLTDLKESLNDVNKFLKNKELANVVSSIDMKLAESNNTDSAVLSRLSNEFDITSVIESVASSNEYNNPALRSTANSLLEAAKQTPYKYLMINPVMESMKAFIEYNCVKSALDKCESYINENKAKLVVLDAANYFASNKTDMNKKTVAILTESLRTNNFNPDSLTMKLGSYAYMCSGLLESLREIRQNESKGFDMGAGSKNVEIYDYIGPVLVEGADVTFNVNGKFIHISPNSVPEEGIEKVIEGKSGIKVFELKPDYVNSVNTRYFNVQKAFESLGFHLDKNQSVANLKKSSVAFKLNESMDVDIMYNGKVSTLDEIKKDGMQMFESSSTKSTLYGLLESTDMICHMNFVKFLTNESAASMIINLGNDYYVYDYTNEGIDTYKFDAFKLYEFCLNKFNYDMSSTFGFAVNDARSKYNKISEGKSNAEAALKDMNESLAKLDEALKGKLDDSDRTMLETLRKSFLTKIDEMKQTYQNLCREEDMLVSTKNCLIKEENDLTMDDNGDPAQGGGEQSTQPEENTTEDQDNASQEGAQAAQSDESIDESKLNEGAQDNAQPESQGEGEETTQNEGQPDKNSQSVNECGNSGVKKVLITYDDGTTSVETVDSELPEVEIKKIYAPGAQINGKFIASSEICEGGECGEETPKSEVVGEVNELCEKKSLIIPEWAVSAIVDGDFRGLTADRYNEALSYKKFLAESGVVSLSVDESKQVEILDKNSMNENREECVHLIYQINENFFKKDIYGVEAPFAGITNLGLFKDGKMKKACNQFLETCAPLIVNKCKFAILQSLTKLKTEGEDKLDDNAKQILQAYEKYDENSLAEEIKNIDSQLDAKKQELNALKDKFLSSKKELAPAFKYDIALTMSKLGEIKAKILEAFREGKAIDGVEQMDKFKASESVANLVNKAVEEAKKQSDELKSEAEKLKSTADEVAKGAENHSESGEGGEKVKAFNLEGKDAEIELRPGIKLKNDIDGDDHYGTEFELGEKSEDGTKFKVIADGAGDDAFIEVETLKNKLPDGGYKVVSMPENNNGENKDGENKENAQTESNAPQI